MSKKRKLPRTAEKDSLVQMMEQALALRTAELDKLWLNRLAEDTAKDIEEKAS